MHGCVPLKNAAVLKCAPTTAEEQVLAEVFERRKTTIKTLKRGLQGLGGLGLKTSGKTKTWNYATYHPFLTTSRATEIVTSFKLFFKQKIMV